MKIFLIITIILFSNTYAQKTSDNSIDYIKFEDANTGIFGVKPEAWHLTKSKKKTGNQFFSISREKPQRGFQTGLTINIIKNVKEQTKVSPVEYAKYQILTSIAKGYKVLEKTDVTKIRKNIMRCGLTIEKELTVQGITQNHTVHYTYICNEKIGTLYILIFGTPSKNWAKDKEIWGRIKTKFNIESDT